MVTGRKLLAACTVCNQGISLEDHMLSPTVNRDPIPFMQKWGLAIFVALVALLIAYFAKRA
ncbi:MAG: hypothetical protein ABSB60_01845 [Terracidiphilus sp.]|jgi:hypothetical protein